MNDIRIAFFDVDGTLFSHTRNEVPESTRQALKALRELGLVFFLAGAGISGGANFIKYFKAIYKDEQ